MSSDDPLLRPLRFPGGAVSKNRLALAPLTNLQSHPDGRLSDEELRWLERRAAGGFGLVTTCAAYVAKDGKAWPGQLGVDDDAQVPRYAELARAIAAHGALGIVQLFHGGVRATRAETGERPWSASEFTEESAGFEAPRAATEDDLARVIGQFEAAARRSAAAGFAGVEVHGAHGYLPSQFLSAVFNRRDDAWGGPLDRRARLIRSILRTIKAAAPAGFIVGVRLSPEDFGYAKGLDLDETVQVARWLCEDGADYVHLSLWRFERMTAKRPVEHALPLFRAALPAEVPLFAAGAIWSPADAHAVLARGADVVALGRAGIVNPDWPAELAAGGVGWEPRRPPMTAAELDARAVSPRFVQYLRSWKNFVAD